MIKPVTSTNVATNGAEALAGSNPTPFSTNGSIEPDSEPKVHTPPKCSRHSDGHQMPMGPVVVEARQLPNGNSDQADNCEDRAQGHPGRQFSDRNAPPIGQVDFAKRERADEQRGGLGPGIPARTHDQRNE